MAFGGDRVRCSTENEHYGRYINYLSKLIKYAINTMTQYDGESITGEQCRILGYICHCYKDGQRVYQRDIEAVFGIKRSSVTSIVGNLEKGGYITRQNGEKDSRVKQILLTEKGQNQLRRSDKFIECVEAQIVKGFDEEEKETFFRLIKAAVNNMESMDGSLYK